MHDSSTLSLNRLVSFTPPHPPMKITFDSKTRWLSLCFLSSFQPIAYEGQNKNPEMCRVLLTHEVMCR